MEGSSNIMPYFSLVVSFEGENLIYIYFCFLRVCHHPQGCTEYFPVATHLTQSAFEKLVCLFKEASFVIPAVFTILSRKPWLVPWSKLGSLSCKRGAVSYRHQSVGRNRQDMWICGLLCPEQVLSDSNNSGMAVKTQSLFLVWFSGVVKLSFFNKAVSGWNFFIQLQLLLSLTCCNTKHLFKSGWFIALDISVFLLCNPPRVI